MISAAAKEIVNARETGEVALHLLTLSHPSLETLRLVADDFNLSSNGETFTASWFDWRRPNEGPITPRGGLRVWNGDGIIGTMIDSVDTPISARIDIVFASAPNTLVKSWPHYQWINITYDAVTANGELTQPDYGRELWPPRVMNEADFPGANF